MVPRPGALSGFFCANPGRASLPFASATEAAVASFASRLPGRASPLTVDLLPSMGLGPAPDELNEPLFMSFTDRPPVRNTCLLLGAGTVHPHEIATAV